jgi:hypothetical protein
MNPTPPRRLRTSMQQNISSLSSSCCRRHTHCISPQHSLFGTQTNKQTNTLFTHFVISRDVRGDDTAIHISTFSADYNNSQLVLTILSLSLSVYLFCCRLNWLCAHLRERSGDVDVALEALERCLHLFDEDCTLRFVNLPLRYRTLLSLSLSSLSFCSHTHTHTHTHTSHLIHAIHYIRPLSFFLICCWVLRVLC